MKAVYSISQAAAEGNAPYAADKISEGEARQVCGANKLPTVFGGVAVAAPFPNGHSELLSAVYCGTFCGIANYSSAAITVRFFDADFVHGLSVLGYSLNGGACCKKMESYPNLVSTAGEKIYTAVGTRHAAISTL